MSDQQPDMDVVDVLSTDHRDVVELISRILATADPAERRDMADTVIAELMRHAVAEEMYVYPAMRDAFPDGEEAVAHDIEEHKEIEATLKALEGVDATDPRFTELVVSLQSTLADHVSDEEGEQFPRLRAILPRAQLMELADKVETAKKVAPTRPHPSAPNNELFHKLAGPGVGLVDRLRDKLSGRSGS